MLKNNAVVVRATTKNEIYMYKYIYTVYIYVFHVFMYIFSNANYIYSTSYSHDLQAVLFVKLKFIYRFIISAKLSLYASLNNNSCCK